MQVNSLSVCQSVCQSVSMSVCQSVIYYLTQLFHLPSFLSPSQLPYIYRHSHTHSVPKHSNERFWTEVFSYMYLMVELKQNAQIKIRCSRKSPNNCDFAFLFVRKKDGAQLDLITPKNQGHRLHC